MSMLEIKNVHKSFFTYTKPRLQAGIFPPTVGMAARHTSGKKAKYSYWISGPSLVKFRHGELPVETHIHVER